MHLTSILCYAIIELKQPLVTGQSQARKLDTLSQHAVMTNHKSGKSDILSNMHSAGKLSWHALQNMHCMKEAAKAQNSRQADTAK